MITQFDMFCISHACAPGFEECGRWCPIADDMGRDKDAGRRCRERWQKKYNMAEEETPRPTKKGRHK